MEIRRLTHFIALAEEGRFAAAAERMHLSQAAFSRSIQMLEGRMGVKLFERGAKGASLTPAGEMVLSRARNLVLDARNLQYDVDLIRQGDAGEITLGAAPVPATVIVPELLSRLRRNSPRLVTRVRLGNLPALLGQLNAQAIDFCLGDPRLVPPQARYAMVSVGRQIGAFYGRIDHPLVQHKLGLLREADISTYKFRTLTHELARLLAYEATRDFELEPVTIDGWCGDINVQRIKGKKVTVVVELQARFDEEANLNLADRLQEAGRATVLAGFDVVDVLVFAPRIGPVDRAAARVVGNAVAIQLLVEHQHAGQHHQRSRYVACAEAVGIQQPSIFNHFASKADMVAELFEYDQVVPAERIEQIVMAFVLREACNGADDEVVCADSKERSHFIA